MPCFSARRKAKQLNERQAQKEGIHMLTRYLESVRRSLFDGEITPFDYDGIVKRALGDALSAHSITYTEWAHLYYQYIG